MTSGVIGGVHDGRSVAHVEQARRRRPQQRRFRCDDSHGNLAPVPTSPGNRNSDRHDRPANRPFQPACSAAAKLLMTVFGAAAWQDARRSQAARKTLADSTFRNPNLALELALLGILATLWGASYTFIKVGVETIPPVTLIAARTLIAGSILLLVMRLRGIALPKDRGLWLGFLVQACINSVIPFTLIAWGEKTVDAGLATILNSTSPIFTFLLTVLLVRHEAMTARKLFGVVAGMTGICLIVGLEAVGGFGDALIAQLAIIAATVSYAGAAIFGRRFMGLDSIVPAAGSMLCGTAILIPASLAIDQPWQLSPSMDSVLALLALSVFSTALAFTIYFRLLHTLGSVGTTSQAYLRVPIGVAIGALFLGEAPGVAAYAGLVCVVLGVAAMIIPARAQSGRPALR